VGRAGARRAAPRRRRVRQTPPLSAASRAERGVSHRRGRPGPGGAGRTRTDPPVHHTPAPRRDAAECARRRHFRRRLAQSAASHTDGGVSGREARDGPAPTLPAATHRRHGETPPSAPDAATSGDASRRARRLPQTGPSPTDRGVPGREARDRPAPTLPSATHRHHDETPPSPRDAATFRGASRRTRRLTQTGALSGCARAPRRPSRAVGRSRGSGTRCRAARGTRGRACPDPSRGSRAG